MCACIHEAIDPCDFFSNIYYTVILYSTLIDRNDGFFGFDLEDSYGSEDEDNVFSGGFGFGGGFGMNFQFESHTASSQGM